MKPPMWASPPRHPTKPLGTRRRPAALLHAGGGRPGMMGLVVGAGSRSPALLRGACGSLASPLRSSRCQTTTMGPACLRWWMSHRLSVCTLCCELLSSDSFRSSADSENDDMAGFRPTRPGLAWLDQAPGLRGDQPPQNGRPPFHPGAAEGQRAACYGSPEGSAAGGGASCQVTAGSLRAPTATPAQSAPGKDAAPAQSAPRARAGCRAEGSGHARAGVRAGALSVAQGKGARFPSGCPSGVRPCRAGVPAEAAGLSVLR